MSELLLEINTGFIGYLLRFLRAECSKSRKFHLKKSEKRLLHTLEWRRKYNVDALLDNPPEAKAKVEELLGELEVMDNEGRCKY